MLKFEIEGSKSTQQKAKSCASSFCSIFSCFKDPKDLRSESYLDNTEKKRISVKDEVSICIQASSSELKLSESANGSMMAPTISKFDFKNYPEAIP